MLKFGVRICGWANDVEMVNGHYRRQLGMRHTVPLSSLHLHLELGITEGEEEEYSFIKSLTERNDIQSRQGDCHYKVDIIYTWIYIAPCPTHRALRHESHCYTCKLHHACPLTIRSGCVVR